VRRWRVPLAALTLLVAALVVAEVTTGHASSHRDRAPELPAEVLAGEPVDLAALEGDPTAINFWASWCPPCQREAPAIEHLSTSLPKDTRLVGVDWNDTRSGAHDFISRYGWTFTNLRDSSGSVGDAYGIQGLPTTVIVDSKGRIAKTLRGPQTARAIDAALRSADR
jgi:cytochrome c biogenesis protein CcmG, thiol:disulfide interchange protein DsbE